MKPIETKARKNPDNGKNTIMIELDEDDVIVLDEAVRSFDETFKGDKDDNKFKEKLKHNKEKIHEIWTLLHPS